jgi:signal recognition particle subunit SEC65
MIKKLKKEFEIDFRKDVYLQNTFGLSPVMDDYNTVKAIVAKANNLAKANGYVRVYNLDMEVEKLRTESLHKYLKNLELKIEEEEKAFISVYNEDLDGYVITFKNGKVAHTQFEIEDNKLSADFGEKMIKRYDEYDDDLTEEEHQMVDDFVTYFQYED